MSMSQNNLWNELGGKDKIKELLEKKKKEILSLYYQDFKEGQIKTIEPEDFIDMATSGYERELHLSLSDTERKTLEEIEQALQRLETGQYGICQNCGKTIQIPRLKAVPWARFCIKCQQMYEEGLI